VFLAFLVISTKGVEKMGVSEYAIGAMLTAFVILIPAVAYYVGVTGYFQEWLER